MTPTDLETLEASVMQLPKPDRVHLAERLLASLGDDDDEILAEWVAEAERRADAYDSGEIQAVSLEEAMRQARAGLLTEDPLSNACTDQSTGVRW
jgi:putative addiction module component (TIGR02574 family)